MKIYIVCTDYSYHFDWYKLLHCPFDGEALTMEEANTVHYHVQMDVPRNQSLYMNLQCSVKHDETKKIGRLIIRICHREQRIRKSIIIRLRTESLIYLQNLKHKGARVSSG